MDTINISLPEQLKFQADELISHGYFASFSDLVRTAIRKLISESEFDILARQAIDDHRKNKGTVLSSKKDINRYLKNLVRE